MANNKQQEEEKKILNHIEWAINSTCGDYKWLFLLFLVVGYLCVFTFVFDLYFEFDGKKSNEKIRRIS